MAAATTATATSAILPPPAPAADYPASPRKRRRRAPASGAADDCFACRKRHVKCDRRRPYCSQCLDQGKDCSGYKTQLTWGVGVASRGKLRGLSLPVAKKTTAVSVQRPQSRKSFSMVEPMDISQQPHQQQHQHSQQNEPSLDLHENSSPKGKGVGPSFETVSNHDYVNVDSTGISSPSVITSPDLECQSSAVVEAFSTMQGSFNPGQNQSFLRQPLHVHTPLHGQMEDLALPASAGSLSGYSESDFSSPVDFPQTPDEHSYVPGPLSIYPSFPTQRPLMAGFGHLHGAYTPRRLQSIPASYGYGSSMESSLSSDPGSFDYMAQNPLFAEPIGPCNLSDILYDDELADGGVSNTHDIELGFGCDSQFRSTSQGLLTDQSSCSTAIESSSKPPSTFPAHRLRWTCETLPRRIQFLLYHYDHVMCPAMTAIDGAHNPYRAHILPMVMQSESLRCAVAAFSLSNLRRRKRNSVLAQERALQRLRLLVKPSTGHDSKPQNTPPTNASSGDDAYELAMAREARSDMSDPVRREEIDFKRRSIQLLNPQFADSSDTKDDAVLATLLILCSYHLCETGVAQFRTQFAGVKKLLGLRKSGVETGIWGWMETLFTWFDAMTATVNDREAQLRGGYLEMVALANDSYSLENLAGCDGRLFKILARLGRLNLLSQKRPVLDALDDLPRAAHLPPPTCMSASPAGSEPYPHSLNYYEPIDRDRANTPKGPTIDHDDHDSTTDMNDERAEFWKEWKEVRANLRAWTYRSSLTAPQHLLSPTLHDLEQISEAFRAAALLYTERLAYPQSPSVDPHFQAHVATVLLHISRIPVFSGVNKFLLWPLFIAGSESVDSAQRGVIRQRCLDIQKESGFFNNTTSLEILERIWNEDQAGTEHGQDADGNGSGKDDGKTSAAVGGKAFKWRKVMEEVDGEFCMI